MSKIITAADDIERFLDSEKDFSDKLTGTKALRVKLEENGDAWLVRFLPVALGKSGRWYIRTAKHWFRRRPVVCPRHMPEDFGGDPNAECPVCDLSSELRDETHEELNNIGFEIRPTLAYLTYCLVYKTETRRGGIREMRPEDILVPWEFQLYKGTFDELSDYYRRGRTESRPLSVLDLKRGNDFWATKTKKGIRLDKDDPGPAFAKDVFEEAINAVFSAIKEPRIKLDPLKALETFARKCRAEAYGEGEPESRTRRAGRASGYDETDEDEGKGRHGRGRRGDDDDDDRGSSRGRHDDEERSSRRSRDEEEPEDRGSRRSRQREEEPEDRGSRRSRRDDDDRGSSRGRSDYRAEDDEPRGRGRREDDDRQERSSRRSREDDDQVPGAEVPPKTAESVRSGKTARSVRGEDDVNEEEDSGVTEEDKDQAPPRRGKIQGDEEPPEDDRRESEGEAEEGAERDEGQEDQEDRRSSSAGSVGGRSGSRGSSLKDRIRRVTRH